MQAIILAAGKGTRMGSSDTPKVMYTLSGVPMIYYVVKCVKQAGISEVILVVGYQKEKIISFLGPEVKYALQEQQLGTGHAVMAAVEQVKEENGEVLVCYGDMPLLRPETLKKLMRVQQLEEPTIILLSVLFQDPFGYGRIIRDASGGVQAITEQKDCTFEQQKIKEVNTGIYMFNCRWLKENISKLNTNNTQKEYYLTDLIKIARQQGEKVMALPLSDPSEALGINTLEQLQQAEQVLLTRG